MEEQVQSDDSYVYDTEIEWQPLALTLVEYPKGDWLGKFFALISLSPFGILAGLVALILFRRDLHTMTFFFGTLVNEVVNAVLKRIIAAPRPLARAHQYAEYGMPSSHAQFTWFFATYVLYFVLLRVGGGRGWWFRVLGVVGAVTLALLVSFARVYLHYHTTTQVICGAAVGVILASMWFALVQRVLTPLFPHLVNTRFCEALMVRDTSLIPNVLWFEYTATRHESRARARKLAHPPH